MNYYIAFSSRNSGNLGRIGGSATLPYSFEVNGSEVSLSSGYNQAITGESPTTGGPRSYRLSFTVGTVSGAPDGDYEDTITIDVVSR